MKGTFAGASTLVILPEAVERDVLSISVSIVIGKTRPAFRLVARTADPRAGVGNSPSGQRVRSAQFIERPARARRMAKPVGR